MLKNRIIPCLDVKNGRVVKGINFVDLKDAGDPVEQAKIYSDGGADEICFLDITASKSSIGSWDPHSSRWRGRIRNRWRYLQSPTNASITVIPHPP